MNEKPKETRARVYLRRAVLAALDAAIVAFSFYFALLLRADGAVEAAWWPHNLAILYRNLPWIVAVYVASFLLGGLYSVLWKYAGERDLLRLAVMTSFGFGNTELCGSELIIVGQGAVDSIEDFAFHHTFILQLIYARQEVARMLIRGLTAAPRIAARMTFCAIMLQCIAFAAILDAKVVLQIFLNRVHHISTLPFSALQ